MSNKGKAIILIFLAAAIFLGFRFGLSLKNRQSVGQPDFLFSKFPKGFDSIGVKLEDLLVVRGIERAQDEAEFGYSSLQPPIVYSLNKDRIVQDQYEVYFEREDNDKSGIFTTQEFRASDLDGGGKEELLSEWTISYGGSDGLKGLVIWEISNGQLVPKSGYHSQIGTEGLTVKNIQTGQLYQFGITRMSNYTRYGSDIFDYANYIWDLEGGESHYGPHAWELQRFVFKDNGYIPDPKWNRGEMYTTKEKIDYDDADDTMNQRLFELFEKLSKLEEQ